MRKKIVLLSTVAILIGCKGKTHVYMYEVTGTGGPFDVTYENIDGNSSSINDIKSGWHYKWQEQSNLIGPERFLSIEAQSMNPDGGTVTVKIFKDGKVIESNTCSGEYEIASCNEGL